MKQTGLYNLMGKARKPIHLIHYIHQHGEAAGSGGRYARVWVSNVQAICGGSSRRRRPQPRLLLQLEPFCDVFTPIGRSY
jgi:hypothetical protein